MPTVGRPLVRNWRNVVGIHRVLGRGGRPSRAVRCDSFRTRHHRYETRTALWLGVLLVDLIAPIAILPAVKPQAELYPSSPAMEYLTSQPEPIRVLDWDTGGDNAQASFSGRRGAAVDGVPRRHSAWLQPAGRAGINREFLAFVVNDPQTGARE